MLSDAKMAEIRETGRGGPAQKAKLYNEHMALVLEALADLEEKLKAVDIDPEIMAKLKAAAKVDPNHLQRLLALENAVFKAGYGGVPAGGN